MDFDNRDSRNQKLAPVWRLVTRLLDPSLVEPPASKPALLANNAHLAMKLLGKDVHSRAISSAAMPEYEIRQDRMS